MEGKGFGRRQSKVKLKVPKVAEEKYERFKTNSQYSIGTGDFRNKITFIVFANGSKAAVMDVIGFLFVSLSSSTVHFHEHSR
jgi:hypothetical protein